MFPMNGARSICTWPCQPCRPPEAGALAKIRTPRTIKGINLMSEIHEMIPTASNSVRPEGSSMKSIALVLWLVLPCCIQGCHRQTVHSSDSTPTLYNANHSFRLTPAQVAELSAAAEHGDGEAAYRLYKFYWMLGTSKVDSAKGRAYLEVSAKAGNTNAMADLAKVKSDEDRGVVKRSERKRHGSTRVRSKSDTCNCLQ
jgi:hypothetical protein